MHDPTFPLQNVQKTIPDQNRVHHDNKDQGQMLKHNGICPLSPAFFPMAISIWYFPDFRKLILSLLQ